MTKSLPAAPANDIATAYHEAGHAVVALALGRAVHKVSVEPNSLRLGQCALQKGSFRPSDDIVETEIMILLGGLAAEARHAGGYCWDAAGQDLRDIRSLTATRIAGAKKQERWERRLLDKTEHLLDQPGMWPAVERIAEELLRTTTISGRAARHHFEQAIREAEKSSR